MTPRARKVLWLAACTLVSALCIAYVLWRADFHDRVDVTEGAAVRSISGRITDRSAASVTIRPAHGPAETIPMDRVALDPRTGSPIIVKGFLHVFGDVFSGGGWPWFVAAVLAYTLSPLFGAWRWRMLLKIQDIHLSFSMAWRLTYIGFFFNTFALGVTGGDVVKAWYAAKQAHQRKTEAVTTVFLDRVVGLFGLALLCLVALALRWNDPAMLEVRIILLAFLGLSAAGAAVFYSRHVRRALLVERLMARLPERVRQFAGRLDAAVFVYRYHRGIVLVAILQSWGAHVVSIASAYFSARALGLDPAPTFFLIYMPAIWIIAAFVPSLGALGVIEGLFQRYFTAGVLGVGTAFDAPAMALAMAFLFRAAQFAAVLPGGVLNVIHPEVSVKEAVREMELGGPGDG